MNKQAKHLRAFLVGYIAQMLGVTTQRTLPLAAAVELIHTYSLVHDDLPAMDNDDFRRGKPSCHQTFGEATAILVGDALQCLAFEVVAGMKGNAKIRCSLIAEMAKAAGRDGLVGGQTLDLMQKQMSYNSWVNMVSKKTAALFILACKAAAILAEKQKLQRSFVKFGYNVGVIFQIKDDLKDMKDIKSSGSNILAFYSNTDAQKAIDDLMQDTEKTLQDELVEYADRLRPFLYLT